MVVAAQRGDRDALSALAAGYLPLVYNIVGRAMNGHPDVDDVVQETMLRAVRGLGELRDPRAFRSWLVAIAIRQVRDSYRDRLAQPPAVEFPAVESAAPVPDFAGLTIERLGLSGQRLQTAEATRWLDDDDRPVLALWWQEAAGQLTRAELAAGLGVTPAHAAVRVARMKERLATSRAIVHALARQPRCANLADVAAGWDGVPSPLWRKRLARHVKDCAWCADGIAEMIPAERLLGVLPLLAVPAGLAGRVLSQVAGSPFGALGLAGRAVKHAQAASGHGIRAARHARHARVLSQGGAAALPPKLVAVSLAVVTCAAGGTFAVTRAHRPPAPAASVTVAPPVVARGQRGAARHPHGRAEAVRAAGQEAVAPGVAPAACPGDREQRAQGREHLELRRRRAGAGGVGRVLVLQLGLGPERHHRPGERELRPDDLGRRQRHQRDAFPGQPGGARPARLQRAGPGQPGQHERRAGA